MSSQYLLQIERLVAEKGSLAEKQLIQRWRRELDRFLASATRQLLNQSLGLEFGIEDRLTLKIILKNRGHSPAATLLTMMEDNPALAPWGKYALQHQLRFHLGIKLTPERFSREIYLYPKDYPDLAARFVDLPNGDAFIKALTDIKPLGIGIDDQQGYSLYFDAIHTTWVDTLRQELGLPDWQGSHLWAWQQMRFNGNTLLQGKTALEVTPLPLAILTRFVSHYPFPYFRYLIPLRPQRDGNFGRDPVTGRFALYTTVN